jgi:hypothetical protein
MPFFALHCCLAGTLATQWQAASMLRGPHLRCRQLLQAHPFDMCRFRSAIVFKQAHWQHSGWQPAC